MRPLNLLLFAALNAMSVANVAADDDVSGSDPGTRFLRGTLTEPNFEEHASSEDEDERPGMFDSDVIGNALGTVSEDINFFDVFVKILTKVKTKALDGENARGFVKRLAILADSTTFFLYMDILRDVIECYLFFGDQTDGNEQALLHSVQRKLDTLFEYMPATVPVVVQRLSPSVTNLLLSNGENARDVAKNVVNILLRDIDILVDLRRAYRDFLSINVPMCAPAYPYVTSAIKFAHQHRFGDESTSDEEIDEDRLPGLFNPAVIDNAFGTLTKDIVFYDVFVKVFTKLKTKELDTGNAVGFLERLIKVAENTSFWRYINVLLKVVTCYAFFGDQPEANREALLDSVQKYLDSTTAEPGASGHAVWRLITPLVTRLISSKPNGGEAEDIAKAVVNIFLMDSDVQEILRDIYYSHLKLSNPMYEPAYPFVKNAIHYAKQHW